MIDYSMTDIIRQWLVGEHKTVCLLKRIDFQAIITIGSILLEKAPVWTETVLAYLADLLIESSRVHSAISSRFALCLCMGVGMEAK